LKDPGDGKTRPIEQKVISQPLVGTADYTLERVSRAKHEQALALRLVPDGKRPAPGGERPDRSGLTPRR